MNLTINDRSYADKAWARIKLAREAAETGGFLFNGVMFDSDPISVQRISTAASEAIIATIPPFKKTITKKWTSKNNTVIDLNGEGLINLALALAKHQDLIFNNSRAKRAEIEAATTAAQLDAIVW